MIHTVDDAVGTNDNFTNPFIGEFWNYSAKLRELSERLGVRDKKLSEAQRPIRRIKRNVADYITKIFAGRVR